MASDAKKPSKASPGWILKAILLTAVMLVVMFGYSPVLGFFYAFAELWILAPDGPLEEYRKFIRFWLVPFLLIAHIIALLLESYFYYKIPGNGQRIILCAVIGLAVSGIMVFSVVDFWARARLRWVTLLNPRLDRAEALRFLRSLTLGISYPVFFAEVDKFEKTREGGAGGFLNKVGGPGMLVAEHGCAVVLESGGKFTRIVKGVELLEQYEQPKAAVDLRQKRTTLRAQSLMTLDGTAVDLDITLWYQIKRKPQPEKPKPASPPTDVTPPGSEKSSVWKRFSKAIRTRYQNLMHGLGNFIYALGGSDEDEDSAANGTDGEGASPHADLRDLAMAKKKKKKKKVLASSDEFGVDDADILRAVYKVADWQASVEGMAIHIARDIVAERTLSQLVERDGERGNQVGRVAVRVALRSRLEQWLADEAWGVELAWVDVGEIAVPRAAQRRMLEKWLATWEVKIADAQKEAIITRGEAEAAATSAQEAARARASMQLINNILEAIENAGLGREEAVERVINLRIIDALEKMASEHVNGFFLPAGLLEGMTTQRIVNKIDGDGTKGPAE